VVSNKTFRLLFGSAAANVVTTLPPGYPAYDFYGNPISVPAAAGAVQAYASGYYLETEVSNSDRGTVSASPAPDADGMVPAGPVVLTATLNANCSLAYWLVNDINMGATNPFTFTPTTHSKVIAVFTRTVTVSLLADTGTGTLRAALTDQQDRDIIQIMVGTPGTDIIALARALPQITKSITIEGNGVTLTRAASWTATSATSQLLYIDSTTAQVTIRRVHFKDGRATNFGAGIRTSGELTLESCVFSGNQSSGDYSGAIYSSNTLTLRGCTFYGNTADNYGGAVYFTASDKTLTLRGNLFYGNTASSRTVYVSSGSVDASYNAVDKAFGTGTAASGWTQGTGDTNISAGGLPVSPKTFRPLFAQFVDFFDFSPRSLKQIRGHCHSRYTMNKKFKDSIFVALFSDGTGRKSL
jgi:hypothetical protein